MIYVIVFVFFYRLVSIIPYFNQSIQSIIKIIFCFSVASCNTANISH